MKHVRFREWDCVVERRQYGNGRPALLLVDANKGEPVATATVNLPDMPASPNHVFIKDYSENEGMLKALTDAGVVKATGITVESGFASIPVVELQPPFREKDRQETPSMERTGFADSHGDFARDLLADMEQKKQTTLGDLLERSSEKQSQQTMRKSRDGGMER